LGALHKIDNTDGLHKCKSNRETAYWCWETASSEPVSQLLRDDQPTSIRVSGAGELDKCHSIVCDGSDWYRCLMSTFEAYPDFIARLESVAADSASPPDVRERCILTLGHYRGKRFVTTYVTAAGDVIDCFRTDTQPGVSADGPAKPPEFAGLPTSRPAQEPGTATTTRCPPGCYPELRRSPEERVAERREAANKGVPLQ
jgi:hypothetical protein